MTSTTHLEMHNEHRFWAKEISQWRDDLRAWQQELTQAQSEIKLFERALAQQAETLRLHASSLRLEEQTFDGHEHALAEYERSGGGDELPQLALQHRDETALHIEHRQAHERLKRWHRKVIAHWALLLSALGEPAGE